MVAEVRADGRDRLPVFAHPLGSGVDVRPSRHHSRGTARAGRRRGRAEGHQAPRGGPDLRERAAGRCVPAGWRASSASRRCPTAARCASPSRADWMPVVKMAAQYPLANFVSREPSLEDMFLRYYQDDGVAAATGSGPCGFVACSSRRCATAASPSSVGDWGSACSRRSSSPSSPRCWLTRDARAELLALVRNPVDAPVRRARGRAQRLAATPRGACRWCCRCWRSGRCWR